MAVSPGAGAGSARLAPLAALGGFDRSGEVADARVERGEDAADRTPVGAALAALETADEGGVYTQTFGELFLGDRTLLAQRTKGVAEDALLLLGARRGLASHGREDSRAKAPSARVFMVRFSC